MRLSKILSVIFCLVLAAAAAFGEPRILPADKAEADKVWQLLEASDSRGAYQYLAELLERNGASVNARGDLGLKLELKDVTEVINDYSGYETAIRVSRMPTTAESKIYWENWSKVLAKGNFPHEKFFRDERERFLLANFNSLVLMAHEYGHYLDDRYGREQYNGAALNCGEYFADKFAVAVINHLADQDERFARLRDRYLEMIKAFDRSLPKENQIRIANYETLKNDCAAVKMEGNGLNADGSLNYDFFRTYASAYFNRHQLMLADKDYPKLSALIETELIKPHFASIRQTGEKVTVRTLGEFKTEFVQEDFDYDFDRLVKEQPNSPRLDQASQLRSAISQSGEIVHLRADWSGKKGVWQNLKIDYLTAEKKVKDSFSVKVPTHLQKHSYLFNFVPVTDDEMILFFGFYNGRAATCGNTYARASKRNGKWEVNFSAVDAIEKACYTATRLNQYVTPGGKLKFVVPTVNAAETHTEMRKYRLDYEKMTLVDEGPHIIFDSELQLSSQTIFGNDADRIFAEGRFIYELDDQTPILVGNGLTGYRDGTDKNKIEFGDVRAIRWVSEKRIVLVDEIDENTQLLREIIFE